ncbi:MAG: serine/threonine-protein kinase, partial [Pseudomonadota bacterium]
ALAQFDREAHYLAKLTHPNIARLLDAGIGADDVPFLILEYVDGVAIDRYCDQRRLTIDSRLRLLTTVVDAVAHAHSQLIVHNDIKPSNVLVTADGTVKLLDFGIATLLHDDDTETVVGLTPEFAAPEQLSRAGATTATDIYSLGMLLHVLVAGRVPRRLSETDSLKRLQQEASREVPGLAETLDESGAAAVAKLRQTSVARLARRLRGELSAIARKALAVRPDKRYASAVELGADLRRYRRSEPVSVLPDTLRYRSRKFAERHRGGVLSAILTVVVLLGAVAVTTYQSVEAKRQRDAALFEQQRTHASYEFVKMLLSEVGPGGKPMSVEELLDRGVAMIDRQYGSQDRFVAYTLYNISLMYASLGQIDSQLDVLARAERIARDVGDERVLGALLCARSRVKHVADPAAAAADLAEGLRVRSRAGTDFIMECARAEGLALSTEGRHEQAMAVFEEALDVSMNRLLEFPAQRAVLLNDLAEQYLLTDRPATALKMLDEVIAIREEIGQGQTINHLITLVNRGTILSRLGELAPAIESIGRAYERVQAMPNPLIGIGVHYAGRLSDIGRYDEALAVIEPEHARALEADNQRWAAQAAMILGLTHARLGDADFSLPYLDSAETFFRKTPVAHQHQLARVRAARTRLQLDAGDIDAARAMADRPFYLTEPPLLRVAAIDMDGAVGEL